MADNGNAEQKSDYAFGQVAIRENVCTFEQVKECLDVQNKLRNIGVAPKKLGEILIEKGYMSTEQAAQITKLQSDPGAAKPVPSKPATQVPQPATRVTRPVKPGGAPQGKVTIPGYEILARLGQGAMGTVYKGRQVSMDRLVAIKVMALKYSKDPQFVERFVREARAVAKLNHENIISGIDVGEVQGIHYFVMEFIDGAPVTKQMRQKGRIDEKRCLEIGLGIAKALAHAHRSGIVHRDVKPENIMITSAGVAKLCDLGLAKQQKGDAGLTMDGMSVGTPNYISPEQARGEEDIDIRADIYSLGASLYHMATGTPVFSGANPMVVMTKHVTEKPEPPNARFKGLSEGFNNLIMKMMSKRRDDRHQTPDALISDIELLQRGGTIVAPTSGGDDHGGTIRIIGDSKPAASPPTARAHARHHRVVTSGGSGSSPMVPILAGVGAVVVIVVVLLMISGGGGGTVDPGTGQNPYDPSGSGGTNPEHPNPPANPGSKSREAEVREQIKSFRDIADRRLEQDAARHLASLYSQIEKRIKDHESQGQYVAMKLWQEQRDTFKKDVNALVNEKHWAPIQKKAEEHLRDENLEEVFKVLNGFNEGLAWFRKGSEPTEAGKAHKELLDRVTQRLTEAFLSGIRKAEGEFDTPATRDRAYQTLDVTAVGKTSDQKVKIEKKRMDFIQQEVNGLVGSPPTRDGYAKAQARLDALKGLHAGKVRVLRELDRLKAEIAKRIASMNKAIVQKAGPMYKAFLPAFNGAMKERDVATARKELHALLLQMPAVGRQFLTATPDTALLEAWLDPTRAAPFADLRKVAELGAQGYKAAQGGGGIDPKEVYFRIRVAALIEDILETAMRGAGGAGSKLGDLAPTLKGGSSASASNRVAGGGLALDVAFSQKGGAVPKKFNVSPRTPPALTEDDIVDLARSALGEAKADGDPIFRLEAFLLYWFGGNKPAAKSHYDKLSPTEQELGMGVFAKSLVGVTSEADEEAVAQRYEDGYRKFIKGDRPGALKLFRECLDKYGSTKYMNVKVPPSGKTRTQIIEGLLGSR